MECRVANGNYYSDSQANCAHPMSNFRTETSYFNKSGQTIYLYSGNGVVLPILSDRNGNNGGFIINKSYTFTTMAVNELTEYFDSVNPVINSELGALKEAFNSLVARVGDRLTIIPEIRLVINFSLQLDALYEGNYLHVPDMNVGLSFSSKAGHITVDTPFDYQQASKNMDRAIINHKEFNIDVKFIDNNDDKGSIFFAAFGKLWNLQGCKDPLLKNGLYYAIIDSDGLIVRDGKTFTREPVFIPIEELTDYGIYSNREAAAEFKLAQNEESIRQSVIKRMELEFKEREIAFKDRERTWTAEMNRQERAFKEKEYTFKEQEYLFKERERAWAAETSKQEREFKEKEFTFKEKIHSREYRASWLKTAGQVAKEVVSLAAISFSVYKLYMEIKARNTSAPAV
jgi:hypothetical protein